MARTSKTPGVSVGDRLVVHAHHLGEAERDAEILAVLAEGGPYRVRWQDDGRVSIIYPGSDVSVEHFPASTRRHQRGDGP
jgi:Domain of unknown function (DUF1918)